MTDKEMLELVAKAAGWGTNSWVWSERAGGFRYRVNGEWVVWNPLVDDGDAFRLEVKLGLHARQFPVLDDGFDVPLGMVEVWRVDDDDPMHVEFLRSGDDRLVATRRAIVRAAAEIGRSMR